MMNLLNKIRTPNRKVQLSKVLLHMMLFAVAGILAGVATNYLIFTQPT